MSSCSLCMRILTCSCISVSGHSGTLLFSLCVYICTEILQYFIIFIIPVCPDTMHSVCTYTCLSHKLAHKLTHKLTPALSYTVIWPFVHLFTPLTTLINTTQFPLIELSIYLCSLYIRTLSSFCFFLCLTTLSLIFLYSPYT
ncbi:hypothetical protein NERG_02678 [Nematocida ausubeli]|uniref:Uncharacterized protein n=1 Tax=Nematocida ausubeli (strain ATCC PRA-371 / ERTm2) TaxID=1913371 RepID=H8ZGF7_NEMA1|nr:hypothetical protein NERG_02678 [Nematocida ausubeli]